MSYETIIVEKDGPLTTITLDRPDRLNAMAPQMADEIGAAFYDLGDSRAVLITGGTGSFGRCMTRRLLRLKDGPSKVVILSRDEFKQYEMGTELGQDDRVRFFLGDVRDRERMDRDIAEIRPDLLIHCAAQPSHDLAAQRPFDDYDVNANGTVSQIINGWRTFPNNRIDTTIMNRKPTGRAP